MAQEQARVRKGKRWGSGTGRASDPEAGTRPTAVPLPVSIAERGYRHAARYMTRPPNASVAIQEPPRSEPAFIHRTPRPPQRPETPKQKKMWFAEPGRYVCDPVRRRLIQAEDARMPMPRRCCLAAVHNQGDAAGATFFFFHAEPAIDPLLILRTKRQHPPRRQPAPLIRYMPSLLRDDKMYAATAYERTHRTVIPQNETTTRTRKRPQTKGSSRRRDTAQSRVAGTRAVRKRYRLAKKMQLREDAAVAAVLCGEMKIREDPRQPRVTPLPRRAAR